MFRRVISQKQLRRWTGCHTYDAECLPLPRTRLKQCWRECIAPQPCHKWVRVSSPRKFWTFVSNSVHLEHTDCTKGFYAYPTLPLISLCVLTLTYHPSWRGGSCPLVSPRKWRPCLTLLYWCDVWNTTTLRLSGKCTFHLRPLIPLRRWYTRSNTIPNACITDIVSWC